MSDIVLAGYARFPELKEDKRERALANGAYFSFPKRDILATWKYKNYVHGIERGSDYIKLIEASVKKALRSANWQINKNIATEYGIYLLTNEGSETAQIKYFQEAVKETIEHINPKSFTELYFNGVMNRLAELYYFRGHSLAFWGKDVSWQELIKHALLGMEQHSQKGCLIIAAEETSAAFGAAVIFIEKEKIARTRGIAPRYVLKQEDNGKILLEGTFKVH